MTNTNVVSINRSPANECPDVGTLIPAGEYRLVFDRSKISTRFGRGSVELWFHIITMGPYFEWPLCRYYKVARDGKRSFRASPHGAFTREFVAIFGKRPPAGIAAVDWFRGVGVVADVETVTKDHNQKRLPDELHYSLIRRLKKRWDGD